MSKIITYSKCMILGVLVLLFFVSSSYAFDPPKDLSWGISMDSVEKLLDVKLKESEPRLYFYELYGMDKNFYRLPGWKLYRCKLEFNEKKREWYIFFNSDSLKLVVIKLDEILQPGEGLVLDRYASSKIQELGLRITAKYGVEPETVRFQRVSKDISTIDELVWRDSTVAPIRLTYTGHDLGGLGGGRTVFIIYGNDSWILELKKEQLKMDKKSKDF